MTCPMPRTNARGFTLLEALAASVILAAGIIAMCGVSTRYLAQTRINRQYETAWQLLDRQLRAVDYIGVNEYMLDGQTEGRVTLSDTAFYWRAGFVELEDGRLFRVDMTVWWAGAGRVHQVSAATMLDDDRSGATGPLNATPAGAQES